MHPLVGIIMGSRSDWETMRHAAEMLERFGVPHETKIVSAHRTPQWMMEYASTAESRGLKAIIAGAGGAAHLPGMVAASTLVPVLGVPVESASLKGLDSLLSIVQMPGGVPVGTLAIGKAGATNAALLAVAMLANEDPALREKLRVFRQEQTALVRQDETPRMSRPILPGATIGVLGSGQLGRMFTIAARRMGYRVHTFSPDLDTPTGQVADVEVQASYDDLDRVCEFASNVSVVTFEFENVPTATAEAAERCAPVRPSGGILHTTQQRIREKAFLTKAGLPLTPYREVHSLDALRQALGELGAPAVLKTAAFGYDGKGQFRVASIDQAEEAWKAIGEQDAVLEAYIDFERELSVVAARGIDGQFVHFHVMENEHRRHILDVTLAPARIPDRVAREAVEIARTVLEKLDVVGVLCTEFFLTRDGRLLINELAPRPHNSGHLTIDACVTSQFEQQLRAVCGLPLGSTTVHRPAAMANLLGDLWSPAAPDFAAACTFPDVKLHLYGKLEPRPGRKMGHLTALATDGESALRTVLSARGAL